MRKLTIALVLVAVLAASCSSTRSDDDAGSPQQRDESSATTTTAGRPAGSSAPEVVVSTVVEAPRPDRAPFAVPDCVPAGDLAETFLSAAETMADDFSGLSDVDGYFELLRTMAEQIVEDSCIDPCLLLEPGDVVDAYADPARHVEESRLTNAAGLGCNFVDGSADDPNAPVLAVVYVISKSTLLATPGSFVADTIDAETLLWDNDLAGGAGNPVFFREGFLAGDLVVSVASCGGGQTIGSEDGDMCIAVRRELLAKVRAQFS
ncbi:MAG: hypothetical protein JWM47_232 [Acidimicrobiales bacterium]|nr:hypothetical protein [Acidimicrobiales bacterium]